MNVHRVGGHVGAGEDEVTLIGDNPFDVFALGELHGLSKSGRQVDVVLLGGFATDELNFGEKPNARNLVL